MDNRALEFSVARLPSASVRYVDVGTGPAIVLLHGSYGSLTHWAANIGPLSSRWRVVALDLPGFGGSSPVPQTSGLEVFAVAVSELLAWLRIDRCALGGFSFGGLVAVEVARRTPRSIDGLILVSPATPGAPPPHVTALQEEIGRLAVTQSLRASVVAMLTRMLLADPGRVTEAAIALTMENLKRTQFRARPLLGRSDLFAALELVNAPLLAIVGDRDPFQERALDVNRGRLAAAARQDCVRVVAGAAHWVCFDRPDDVNALIEGFLAR